MRHSFGILLGGIALLAGAGRGWGAPPKVVSPRVIDEPIWSYPVQAERAGVREGEALAMLSISEEGQLLDFMVLGASHLAFADEVAKSLPKIRFSPAKLRGEPATVRLPLSFYFKQEGTITSFASIDESAARMMRTFQIDGGFVSFVCPQNRLDQPLRPAKVFTPRYPEELRSRRESASVTIDFYVDGEGRVRLPAVETGSHPSFAREAAAALTAWEFDPPRSNGRPVIVRALQTFHFAPPEDKPPAR